MNRFKTMISAAVLMLASGSALAAGGPLDGIYSCQAGGSDAYVTINGQPDGTSVYAVAAIGPTTNFYGYGIGMATSTSFNGQTMFGLPFALIFSNGSVTGSVGMMFPTGSMQVAVSCLKFW